MLEGYKDRIVGFFFVVIEEVKILKQELIGLYFLLIQFFEPRRFIRWNEVASLITRFNST